MFELPELKEWPKNFDHRLSPTSPEELHKILRVDIETFTDLVTRAGLRGK